MNFVSRIYCCLKALRLLYNEPLQTRFTRLSEDDQHEILYSIARHNIDWKTYLCAGDFEPRIEVQRIMAASGEVRKTRLRNFKNMYYRQLYLISRIPKKVELWIETMASSNTSGRAYDDLLSHVFPYPRQFSFLQRVLILAQLFCVLEIVNVPNKIVHQYRSREKLLVERIFQQPADGIREGLILVAMPLMLVIYVTNAADFAYIIGEEENVNHLGCFVGRVLPHFRELSGSCIIVVNTDGKGQNHPQTKTTLKHEIRHAINHYLFTNALVAQYHHDNSLISIKDEFLARMACDEDWADILFVLYQNMNTYTSSDLDVPAANKNIRQLKQTMFELIQIACGVHKALPANYCLDLLSLLAMEKWKRLKRDLAFVPIPSALRKTDETWLDFTDMPYDLYFSMRFCDLHWEKNEPLDRTTDGNQGGNQGDSQLDL